MVAHRRHPGENKDREELASDGGGVDDDDDDDEDNDNGEGEMDNETREEMARYNRAHEARMIALGLENERLLEEAREADEYLARTAELTRQLREATALRETEINSLRRARQERELAALDNILVVTATAIENRREQRSGQVERSDGDRSEDEDEKKEEDEET